MDLKKLLNEKEFIFLDGGMGTMLQAAGLAAGENPELLNLTHPEQIEEINLKSYLFYYYFLLILLIHSD